MRSDVKSALASEDIKLFLNDGAIVQTSINSFKLFMGPFESVSLSGDSPELLYKPNFWDFLKPCISDPALLKAQKVIDLSRNQLIDLLLGVAVGPRLLDKKLAAEELNINIEWMAPDLNQFRQQFTWLQQQIQKKLLSKGLPITVQSGRGFKFSVAAKLQVLKNILQKNTDQYLYGFWNATSGFIGFTPEILVDANKNEFETMALAGTWAKAAGVVNDFKNLKIQNEHALVVEDILKQLSDEQLLYKSETEILEIEYLFHLKTKFKYACADEKMFSDKVNSIQKIIQKLHPTAALGLFPRSKLFFYEFQKLELQNQRQNFGAPFGFVGNERSFVLVAIRNIFWQKNEVSIYSGCGVTADSDFETEWQELESKRNSVKKICGLNL